MVVFLEAHSGLGGTADSFACCIGCSFDSGLLLFLELSPPPVPSGRCHCVYVALDEHASGVGAVFASRRTLSGHKGGALLQTIGAALSS